MRKSIIFALMLTIAAQGVWADNVKNYYPTVSQDIDISHGPWTFEAVSCQAAYDQYHVTKQRFIYLDHTAWERHSSDKNNEKIAYFFNDDDGIGFVMRCRNDKSFASRFGVFSTYSHTEEVPSYTRKRMVWKYQLRAKIVRFPHSVVLYGCNDLAKLKNAEVDFTAGFWGKTNSPYFIDRIYVSSNGTEKQTEKEVTTTFDFDNRKGNTEQVKSYYLLLTHVLQDPTDRFPRDHDVYSIQHYGAFKHISEVWTYYYYQYVTFNANGGKGSMKTQEIENSAALTANAFTRTGYSFAGWATEPDGDVVYANREEIIVTPENKGHVTLYAKWTPSVDGVMASIDAIGARVALGSLNAIHYARAGYNGLGEAEKPQVTNYSKLTDAEAAFNVVSLIHAIGTIENTPACGEKIAAARSAYNDLNATQIALLAESDINILFTAEKVYPILGVMAKIDAIGTVEYTDDCKSKIDAAREAFDALSQESKEIMAASYLKTLQDAEAAYAAFEPSTIKFVQKDGTTQVGVDQQKAIYYPALPAGATEWQTEEKDVTDKTIVIKAIE